ncbi:MAG: carboxypeptidase-like regulatory domain-containing protein, partial [Gemmatimonadaceae bacterium]|nr:carboxypeptidase-like regulatory domain-containing protein [Gemmatimonadaceae bacterium]
MPLLTRSSRLRHALLLFAMGGARTAWAQPADDLRGRVTTDSARAVPGATVFVTRGSDRAVQQTSTDADGRWRVRFDPGTGDYLVFASAVGFQSARRRVQRVADEREFVVDLVLRPVTGTTLAQVTVRSGKPRPDNGVRLGTEEVGASEKWVDGVSAAIAPTARGDLTALAATVPGLVLGAGGASSLGAAPSSALTTLNGVALPAGQLPRGASVDARFSAGTMDATRGGFAGGQLELRVNPGNRDYQRRRAWIAADGAALQATDAIGRNTGAPVTGARFSLGANGEAIRRAVTYDVSVDVARAASDPASLLDASDATRALVALSPDSARRVTDIARNLPLSLGGAGRRVSDSWGLLARIDDTRDTTRVLALTGFLSVA